MGFTKLFSDIVASSIWNEDDKTRIVWITMLAIKGQNHIVKASLGGLAHQARVSMEDCKRAVDKLEGPDPDDSGGLYEGRRVEKVQGGWLVLNGERYRMRRDEEDRRAYMAEYMREYRRKQSVNNREQPLTDVSIVSPSDQIRSDHNKEERERPKNRYVAEIPIGIKTPEFEKAWEEWFEYQSEGRRSGNWNHASQRADLSFLERIGPARACNAIDHTIRGRLDRLCEPIESGANPNNGSSQKTAQFVTREMIGAWCVRKGYSKLAPIARGKLISGKLYGAPITNAEDFNDAMSALLNDWLKTP